METKKRALITGINGQSGSHMADILLEKNYEVFGMERRSSTKNRTNCIHLENRITFLTGDLSDQNSLLRAIEDSQPDEIYNLAAMSFVGASWSIPEETANITGLGVLRMLEAIRMYKKPVKFYQASSSEIVGKANDNIKFDGSSIVFHPRSPYGISKLFGYWIARNYRESYNMYICNGLLYNHESERRGLEFVTRKISNGVAKIYLGLDNKILLGNLDAKRDWGYAPEYMDAAWRMLQQDEPDDYVIATGESHSVREFLDEAFNVININDWNKYVVQDPKYFRPSEVDVLLGDYSKAKEKLGWQPQTSFKEIVRKMVLNDIELLRSQNKNIFQNAING